MLNFSLLPNCGGGVASCVGVIDSKRSPRESKLKQTRRGRGEASDTHPLFPSAIAANLLHSGRLICGKAGHFALLCKRGPTAALVLVWMRGVAVSQQTFLPTPRTLSRKGTRDKDCRSETAANTWRRVLYPPYDKSSHRDHHLLSIFSWPRG